MEVYFPRQRVPDGLAALEGLAHQMGPEAVEGSAELHREGACRRLRGSLSTGIATREASTTARYWQCWHARQLRSIRRHGG